MTGENDLKLLLKALAFAAARHKDQRRKDVEASPYINHPVALADILCNEGHVTDIEVICAALLHDTVEDTATEPEELEAEFGKAIRDIVMEVTDDKTLPKEERKKEQIKHAAALSDKAKLVKLADKAFADETLPPFAHRALEILIRRMAELTDEIGVLDEELKAWHTSNEASRRLTAIPGIGVITATAIAATVTDPDQFRSGRQFAAWLGLTPQQHSTGGKTRLGGISKQGDRYLRRLLVVGATAVMRHAKRNPTPMTDWVNNLLEKKPFRLVYVALANKLARIAWAVLTRGEPYKPYGLTA